MYLLIVIKDNCQIHDISPLISPEIAVFPGDTAFSAEFLLDLHKGDNLTLSTIRTTVHLGAHTDAPSHYDSIGISMESVDLSTYIGPCQVIEVPCQKGERISSRMLEENQLWENLKVAPRILFKTGSFPNPNKWNSDFMAIDPDLIDLLAAKGVRLIGIDTPSVDLAEDAKLEAHSRIAKNKMAILEGIVLDKVSAGRYSLVALPLNLKGADASPVRAILLPADPR